MPFGGELKPIEACLCILIDPAISSVVTGHVLGLQTAKRRSKLISRDLFLAKLENSARSIPRYRRGSTVGNHTQGNIRWIWLLDQFGLQITQRPTFDDFSLGFESEPEEWIMQKSGFGRYRQW
ncbi:hypothetical protein BDD12DRAFT_896445 [Trichophaea hybrida]|nr:hypothetical protein BDD12DRAFT_896445 [Trichophaea hybrida]